MKYEKREEGGGKEQQGERKDGEWGDRRKPYIL